MDGSGRVVEPSTAEERLRAATVGALLRLDGPVVLAEHDPSWAALFTREAGRIRSILGDRALRLEHVGSTSVEGLPAKPIIDILLEVPDSADEAAYLPALEAAGYILRIREPDWFEHRVLKGPDTNINLHVFPTGCEESRRMTAFRDHLRGCEGDRLLYGRTKRELSARSWRYVQDYADAKSTVVGEIMSGIP